MFTLAHNPIISQKSISVFVISVLFVVVVVNYHQNPMIFDTCVTQTWTIFLFVFGFSYEKFEHIHIWLLILEYVPLHGEWSQPIRLGYITTHDCWILELDLIREIKMALMPGGGVTWEFLIKLNFSLVSDSETYLVFSFVLLVGVFK